MERRRPSRLSYFLSQNVGLVLALVMLLISVFMAVYAAVNFKRRGDMLL